MTIHHDKLAYGKLSPEREDVSGERLEEMIKLLNAEDKTLKDQAKPSAESADGAKRKKRK